MKLKTVRPQSKRWHPIWTLQVLDRPPKGTVAFIFCRALDKFLACHEPKEYSRAVNILCNEEQPGIYVFFMSGFKNQKDVARLFLRNWKYIDSKQQIWKAIEFTQLDGRGDYGIWVRIVQWGEYAACKQCKRAKIHSVHSDGNRITLRCEDCGTEK